MGKCNYLVSGLISILFLLIFSGQNVYSTFPEYFRYYGSYENITNISEDGDYLWVSTNHDGIRKLNTITGEFEVFNAYNSDLKSNYVSCSVKDFQNNIWIATSTGIYVYKNNQFRNINSKNSNLPNDTIVSLNIDSKGQVWVAGIKYLSKFDGTIFTNYDILDTTISYNYINRVQIDKNDKIWLLTTYQGIIEFDGINKMTHQYPDSLKVNFYNTNFRIDKDNNVWFGLYTNTLVKFDGKSYSYIHPKDFNSTNPYNYIKFAFSKSGNLIISDLGLRIFDGTNWNYLTRENSQLNDDCISEIFVDSKNNLWLGTCNSELVKIENSVFKFYDLNCETLNNNQILCYSLNHKNEFSVLTLSGISLITNYKWKSYTRQNSNIIDENLYFNIIVRDESGNFWLATSGGCQLIKGAEFIDIVKQYPDFIEPPISRIYTTKNYVYVYSQKGFAKFDGTNWELLNMNGAGLFVFDNKEKLWAFDGIYIKYYDGKNWVRNNNEKFPDIQYKDYYKLAIAKNGNIWVNTDKFLAKYDLNKWEVFYSHDLPHQSDKTWMFKVDSKENVWLLSMEGHLAKFDGKIWTLRKNVIRNIGNDDGYILGMEIDSLDNIFVFTSRAGIQVFHENGVVLTDVTENFDFAKSEMHIYPNPAGDYITIQPSEGFKPSEGSKVKIFNTLGIEVSSAGGGVNEVDGGGYRIDISNLPTGVYFIKIGDRVEKFVKK
jgi:ligand-binding sensor domain-containing protein